MAGSRATVDRALYLSALADAIDWTESLLDGHDGDVAGLGCCDHPGRERCEPYKDAAARLARYRAAYSRITGHHYEEG